MARFVREGEKFPAEAKILRADAGTEGLRREVERETVRWRERRMLVRGSFVKSVFCVCVRC